MLQTVEFVHTLLAMEAEVWQKAKCPSFALDSCGIVNATAWQLRKEAPRYYTSQAQSQAAGVSSLQALQDAVHGITE